MSPRSEFRIRARTFRQRMVLLVALPLPLLGLALAAAGYQLKEVLGSLERVEHAGRVVEAATRVKAVALDMETGVRGYELTGRTEFLQQFDAADQAVLPARAAELSLADPEEAATVHRFAAQLDAWRARARGVLADGPWGLRLEDADPGSALMKGYRQQIEAFIAAEARTRDDLAAHVGEATRALFLKILAIMLLAAVVLGYLSSRQLRASSMAYEAALRRAEQMVVQERAARLGSVAVEGSLRELIENLPEGVLVVRGGILIFANDALARLLRCPLSELVGSPLSRWIHPDDLAKAEQRIAELRAGDPMGESHERRYLRADGSVATVEILGARIVFRGEPAVLGQFHDVTERRELTARMMQMDRMVTLGTLAAGVAHEVNNPLSYVRSNLDFALRELERAELAGKADLLNALGDARMGTERIRALVKDLKGFTRIDEANVEIDVNEAIQASVNMVSAELRHKTQLDCELGQVPPVLGNAGRLEQVFLNLLVNAGHAVEGRPGENVVQIRSVFTCGRVAVQVVDTGAGISEAVKARIFEPFFTTKPVGVGTGLGLSICKSIVCAMGGELLVDSAVGKGSTFSVLLPPASALRKVG